MNIVRRYLFARKVCKKYDLKFIGLDFFSMSDGWYSPALYIVYTDIFSDKFYEVFFHEIGHHVYQSEIKTYRSITNISTVKWGGKPVENILYEEAFASCFARRSMLKFGMKCDSHYLMKCFQTYCYPIYKVLNNICDGKDYVTDITNTVSKCISRII